MKLRSGQVWTFLDDRGLEFQETIDKVEGNIVFFHGEDKSEGQAILEDYFEFSPHQIKGLNLLATFKKMIEKNNEV